MQELASAASLTLTSPATSFSHLCKNGSYSIPFYASGGTGPYTFSTSIGSNNTPPAGMSINSSTGILSGSPTAAGNNPFSVTVRDSASPQNSTTLSVTLQVDSSGSCLTSVAAPTTSSPPTTTVAYNSSNNSINLSPYITGSYSYITISTPPSHGTFTVTGATVSYTPTSGYYGSDSFYYTATSTGGTSSPSLVNITISAPTITISPSSLPIGVVGTAYSQTLTSSGGSGSYSYSVTSGSLPSWMTLSSGGVLSGTPTIIGTSNFTITSTDTSTGNGPATASRSYSLSINGGPPNSISTTTGTTQSTTVSTAFNTALQVTVLDVSNAPVTGATVTFSAPSSGASATFSSTTAITNSSGIASVTATANSTAGSYTVAASVSGVSTPATFNLTNIAHVAITTSSLPIPLLGQSYNQTINTIGGTSPITFSITSGTLPNGLTLNSNTGSITGTPSTSGSYSFTVTATDANNITSSQSYSGTIVAVLAITTSSLSVPLLGQSYNQTINTTGGTSPIVFSISSGALPSGLTLNTNTGAITGTPNTPGSYSFTITATDANSITSSQSYSGTIAASLAITTSSLPAPLLGQSYNQTVSTTGGTAPITFAISSGGLPDGLTLDSNTGNLTGVTNTSGTYSFTITATDANNVNSDQSYNGTITGPLTLTSPATSFSHLCKNGSYFIPFYILGGVSPYTFSTSTGHNNTPPTGMSVNPSTGVLSGISTVSGNYPFSIIAHDSASPQNSTALFVTLQVDSSNNCLTVNPVPTTVAPSVLDPTFTVSYNSINNAIDLSSEIVGGYDYISLSTPPSHGTYTITGATVYYTPTTGYYGTDSFYYTATNSGGTSSPALVDIIVSPPSITISPSTLPSGTAGTAYSQTISSSGGPGGYSYTISSGTLPVGLTLSSSGVLSGTTTAANTYNFTVTSTDTSTLSTPATATQNYSLIINSSLPNSIAATGGATQNTTITTAFSTALQVTVLDQYSNPVSGVTVTFNAPSSGASATLSSTTATTNSSGVASVIATANSIAGSYNVTASISGVSTPVTFSLNNTVNLVITTSTLPTPILGRSYNQTIGTAGGTSPITFAVTSGLLPNGLTLDPSTGSITGTPSTSGSYSFTITATDANGVTSSQSYSGIIVASLAIITPSLLAPVLGQSYNQAISTSGGTSPITFVVSSGALPTGLALDPNTGAITGTANALGAYSFTITATDSNGITSSQSYSGTVTSSLVITTNSLPTPVLGQSYNQTISTSGGVSPITFSITSGKLPNGLTLNSNTGAITGIPNTPGTYSFTIMITDSNGSTFTKTFSWTIEARPDPTKDATVIGTINAQVSSSYRFSKIQIDNIASHLEQVHIASKFNLENTFGIGFNVQGVNLNQLMAGNFTGFARSLNDALGTKNNLIYNQNYKPATAIYTVKSTNIAAKTSDKLIKQTLKSQTKKAKEKSEKQLAFWTSGMLNYGSLKNEGGGRSHFTTSGITLGLDYKALENLILGIATGFSTDSTRIDSYGSHSDANNISGILYVGYKPLSFVFADGLLGYGKLSFKNKRWISQSSLFVNGKRNGHNQFGSLAISGEITKGSMIISPYIRSSFISAKLNPYTEHGATNLSLSYKKMNIDVRTLALGFNGAYNYSINSGVLTPSLKIQYQHAFNTKQNQFIYYTDIGAANYYTLGTNVISQDMSSVQLGLRYTMDNSIAGEALGTLTSGSNSFRERSIKLNLIIPF